MLKLAIQKKGRLTTGTLELFKRAGFEFEDKSSGLINPCKNFPIELLLLRDEDIPEAVSTGAADLGIVGENVLEEFLANNSAAELNLRMKFPFSTCRLSIGVSKSSSIETIQELRNLKVATSYPAILRKFSLENDLNLTPVILNGSVEIAISLGMSDAILDIVSTGETLKQNSLREFYQVLDCSPALVSGLSLNDVQKQEVEELLMRLQSVVQSLTTRYLVFNAPKSSLEHILAVVPSIDSPTLMELANDLNKVAIHTVVEKKDLWKVITTVKGLGATGLLSFPIEARLN